MKKSIIVMVLLFSFATPLKYALNYVVNIGTCIVDYSADWMKLTADTAKCAWAKTIAPVA